MQRPARTTWPESPRVRCVLMFITLVAFVSQAASPVFAKPRIDIEYAEWSFDDRAVPGSFNLLTVGIRNNSAEPFEGTVRLRRLISKAGAWSGTQQVEDTYISPFTTKTIQFYPYVLSIAEEWEVRWGDDLLDAYVTEMPALTSGARVIFNDPEQLSGLTLGLRGFREDFFPPTVSGTETLMIVAMDHMPRWESPRRAAFRDWLYRGGVLHVLHAANGRFPKLPVEELNAEPRLTSFGAGRIYWHERTRGEVSRPYIYSDIYPTSPQTSIVADHTGYSFDVDATSREFFREGERLFVAYTEWDSDRVIPQRLKELVRPGHHWGLIYLCSIGYIGLLFPGGFLLARTRFGYRINLISLLVVVGGFSWLFTELGARGYGESMATTSVAIARPLPDGRFDIEQWNSLFVVQGDDYGITHKGPSVVYSTAQNVEQVDGQIDNGKRGSMAVDMPPFTSRSFVHRTQVELGSFDVEVRDRQEFDGGVLKKLNVETKGRLPGTIKTAAFVRGNLIYNVDLAVLEAGRGNLLKGSGTPIVSVISLGRNFFRFQPNERADTEIGFDRFFQWLMARDLTIRRRLDAQQLALPLDRGRLFVFATLPEVLSSRDAADPERELGDQSGRIMYRIDVAIPLDVEETTSTGTAG